MLVLKTSKNFLKKLKIIKKVIKENLVMSTALKLEMSILQELL